MERWLLLLYFIIYFTATFAWRTWLVWRKTGVNPYVLPRSDDAQGYVASAFRRVLLAIATYVVMQAAWPTFERWFGHIAWMEHAVVHSVGWVMLIAALLWTAAAQIQMGTAWRIGIDHAHETPLVRSGLFAVSRNPIFLAMRTSLLGLFLVRPNALTLTCAVAGELLMQLQVRQEEDFLRQRHGQDYLDYATNTPRWI